MSDVSVKMYDEHSKTDFVGVQNYKGGVDFLYNLSYPFVTQLPKVDKDIEKLTMTDIMFDALNPESKNQLNKKVQKLMWVLWDKGIIEAQVTNYDQYERDSDELAEEET